MYWNGTGWVDDRPAAPLPSATRRQDRIRDVIATIPILLLIPVLILPMLSVQAGADVPTLTVSGSLIPGGRVSVNGAGMPKREWIQVRWDNSVNLVTVRSTSSSAFAATVTIPSTATAGLHVLSASSRESGGGNRRNDASGAVQAISSTLATVTVQVTTAPSEPTPTPTPVPPAAPTPTSTPVPTAAPTPTATPPTATATPTPTAAPTQTPAAPAPTPAPTAAPTPVPTPAPANQRYLAPNGSDSNPGTLTAPWGTLGGAIAKLGPGDTLNVRGGTYVVTTRITYVTVAGTASAPIVIRNYGGETPIFTSSVRQVDYLYFASGARYLTLSGLTFRGPDLVAADSNGESLIGFVGDASDITITGNTFYGSPAWNSLQHLIYIAGPGRNLRIIDNTFDGRGSKGSGITTYRDPNATNVLVSGNRFRNIDQGLLIWSSISGLVIDRNSFSNNRINVQHDHSGGTTITNNSGSATEVNLYVNSSANLVVSGNSW